jgi:hypothetical protein
MREPQLTQLKGSSRLALGFFNSIIRRIECTKPLAGPGITISEKDNGIEISSGGGNAASSSQFILNVCSNGTPAQIIVFGKLVG